MTKIKTLNKHKKKQHGSIILISNIEDIDQYISSHKKVQSPKIYTQPPKIEEIKEVTVPSIYNSKNLFQNPYAEDATKISGIPEFNIKFADINLFRNFAKISTEGTGDKNVNLKFAIDKNGLHTNTLSPSAISMVNVSCPNKYLSKYDVKKEGVIALNIKDFLKDIKNIKNAAIELNSNNNMIEIKVLNSQNELIYNKNIPITETHYGKPLNITAEKCKNIIMINDIKKFKHVLQELSAINDIVSIEAENNKLILTPINQKGEIIQREIPAEIIKADPNNNITKYNIKYLKKAFSSVKNYAPLYLGWIKDEPLVAEYTLDKDIKTDYYIAPYVES